MESHVFAFNHTERYPYGNAQRSQSEIQDSSEMQGWEKSQIKDSAYLLGGKKGAKEASSIVITVH